MNPSNLSDHYRIEKELGHNRAGGRVTYLATDIRTQQQVVIKQFQFAQSGSSWSEYDAYHREIQLLKDLNHPGIPRYLDALQTADGFCMVQEYKKAESLTAGRSFNPDNIKSIAIACLEILVYLQNRIPPVIHRDIKPENILVNEQGNVYLVDFGFARVGEGEVGVSSVVKGTLGFMPPEQLFNRQLTEASDLYGLGMTLICLLTGTKSDRIGDLVDISYRVSFKHLVPKLNMHWVNWLEKMVEPRLKDRYPNAVAALDAVPASPLRPPEAQFNRSSLVFSASHQNELLTQSVVITNPIPETTLEGEWEVAPHPHDPEAKLYRWITVNPVTFTGNQIEFQITVDTRKLMVGKTYTRKLLLHANTLARTYPLNLQIQTAPSPIRSHLLPYGLLSLSCLFFAATSYLGAWMVMVLGTVTASADTSGFGAMLGAAIGLELSAWLMRSSGWRIGSATSTFAAILVGITVLLRVLMGTILNAGSGIVIGAGAGAIGGAIAGIMMGTVVEKMITQGIPKRLTIAISLLTAVLGTSLGLALINLTVGAVSIPILTLLTVSGLTSVALITHLSLQRVNALYLHRRAERHLIKP
ncbi:MAG: serine/threonine-protein kinase [Kovacikia sp.]